MNRTASVPLEGNSYAVDPALIGRRVELRYHPEDLSRIDAFALRLRHAIPTALRRKS